MKSSSPLIWLLSSTLFFACEDISTQQTIDVEARYNDQAMHRQLPHGDDAGLEDSKSDQEIWRSADQDIDGGQVEERDLSMSFDQTIDVLQDQGPNLDPDAYFSPTYTGDSLSISYASSYLLDNFQARDPDYLSIHRNRIQSNPAFYGNIGDRVLPDIGEPNVIYEVFGLQAPEGGLVAILQMSFDGITRMPVNPFIQLSLDSGLIEPGQEYEISSNARKSRLMLFNVNPDLSFQCVRRLGFGSVNIPNASGLTLSEGGSIGVYGSNIPLFDPLETPVGDLTNLLLQEGKSICAEEDSLEDDGLDHTTSLIINEVDYASPGRDQGEFVEIFNPSNAPVDLNGVVVEFIRADASVYQSVNLQTVNHTLGSGDYLVLGDQTIIDQLSDTTLSYRLRDSIQNGGMGNGIRILQDGVAFEEIGYGGLSLSEGTCSVSDDDFTEGVILSLGRCGQDTNINADDFILLTTPTPGMSNECP